MNVWQTYRPSNSHPWDVRRVVHLHRRAGFAANRSTIQRDLADGPMVAVDRMIHPADDHDFSSMADTIGDAAMASGNPERLKAWWFYRMLFSPDPLGERLTLMWHNHFATSNRKVENLVWMREQNESFRKHARAPFDRLLRSVVKHPAMLVWLDADSNRKGHPNENLARELLELFTLGVGHYAESDVTDAARALTGWSVAEGQFRFRSELHDATEKVLLGEAGTFNGDELIDRLVGHPATARRIAARLCQTFMGEDVVARAAMDELATKLQATQLDIMAAIETVLRSELFFSAANIRSRVVSPAESIIGPLRAMELTDPPPSTLLLAQWGTDTGQDLFYPPNVGGWDEGRAWLNSRTVVARANFADALVTGRLWRPTRDIDIKELLRRHGIQPELQSATRWLATLLFGDANEGTIEAIVAAASETDLPLQTMVHRLLTRPEGMLG